MRPDRQTAQRPHVRARPQFTDCSQQEEPCGFSISFSARQTYQPSSGGAPSARAHLKAHGHTLAYCLYKKTHARGINSIKSLSFRPRSTSARLRLSPLRRPPHPDLLFSQTFSHPATPKPSFPLPSSAFRLSCVRRTGAQTHNNKHKQPTHAFRNSESVCTLSGDRWQQLQKLEKTPRTT